MLALRVRATAEAHGSLFSRFNSRGKLVAASFPTFPEVSSKKRKSLLNSRLFNFQRRLPNGGAARISRTLEIHLSARGGGAEEPGEGRASRGFRQSTPRRYHVRVVKPTVGRELSEIIADPWNSITSAVLRHTAPQRGRRVDETNERDANRGIASIRARFRSFAVVSARRARGFLYFLYSRLNPFRFPSLPLLSSVFVALVIIVELCVFLQIIL